MQSPHEIRERLIRAAFRSAGAVAPRAAGRAAFRLFTSPPRRRTLSPGEARMATRMAPLIAQAERRDIAADGERVPTWSWRADGTVRGRVLLVHGWSARALVMTAFVEPLLRKGFDVVALDLPGHGESQGHRLSVPSGAQAVQAVAAAHGGITGLIAHSLGGPISTLAAEGGLPLDGPMAVGRLVVISSPNAMATVARRFAERTGLGPEVRRVLEAEILSLTRRPLEELSVGAFVARVGKPALVIHDADDPDVPFIRAEEIVAAAPAVATLFPTRGIGHRRMVVAPQVIKAAARFLADEELPAEQPAGAGS